MNANPHATADAYQEALKLTRQGDLQRAESICREILRNHASHPEALMLRGVIELQSGRPADAVESFRASIHLQPLQPVAHALLGDALLEVKLPEAALSSYDRGLHLSAALVPAHFGRGNALLDLKRPLEAVASFDKALQLQPNQPETLFNRGNGLHHLKRYEAAVDSYDRAIALNPSYAAAYHNRGGALMPLGRTDQALASFDAALAINPAFAEALNSRGCALRALRRPHEAIASFDRALEVRNDYVDALCGRGDALLDLQRPQEALAMHDRAVALAPDSTLAQNGRGNSLTALRRNGEAIASYDIALRLDPDNVDAHFNRGNALLQFDWRPEEAARSFAALLRSDPDFDLAPGFLLHAQQCCADWSIPVPDASREHIVESVLAGKCVDSPFSFLAVSDSPAAQLRCAQIYLAERFPNATPRRRGRCYRHDKIRVAYVSADFRVHAVSYLLAGLFERHDRQRFETIAISLREEDTSALGQRVKNAFSRFIDASGKTDGEVVELMRAMEIDIAVDLVGLTEGLRPQIFARGAAPIQVSYLGFPGTTGLSSMDYILADDFVIPPEQHAHYCEQVVCLPDCFQVNDDQRAISGRMVSRTDAGLPQSGFVYCCFNNTYKINPAMFNIWMRLLDQVPGSVFWLLGGSDTVRHNLRREASNRGVDPQRLVFAVREPYAEHLKRLRLADLFLDTLPFNAGTTASDALWAGVPLLTCAGEAFAARMAGSILRAIGLPELVTHDLARYEALALNLARQPQTLRELRERLHRNRLSAPLFDTDRFRRHVESAYEQMQRRHELGEAPQSFRVSARPPCNQTFSSSA
ncbi:MAG: tetratricopeptide repeat protein [Steroidobacteraceae bacterium]